MLHTSKESEESQNMAWHTPQMKKGFYKGRRYSRSRVEVEVTWKKGGG